MKRYGGFSRKDRHQYLCDKEDCIIRDRFTGIELDYLKKNIVHTIIHVFPNLQKKHKKDIQKYSKHTLFVLLKSIFTNYMKNIDKIVYIQRYIKQRQHGKWDRLRGPGFKNTSLCNNQEDFLFMIPIEKTDLRYFYSYQDTNNHVWYFDIRSIYKLLKCKGDNPYTRQPFPEYVYKKVSKLRKYLKRKNIDVSIEEYKPKSFEEKVDRKLTDLSISITHSGYTFQKEWIEQLNKPKLLHLYRLLEDLWNYRIQLTPEQKRLIIPPTGIVFNFPIGNLTRLPIKKILNIMINDVNKFQYSIDEGNRKLGYIYLITCLSEINLQCRQYNEWVQWI